jgi:Niemann-Pick C1 protein
LKFVSKEGQNVLTREQVLFYHISSQVASDCSPSPSSCFSLAEQVDEMFQIHAEVLAISVSGSTLKDCCMQLPFANPDGNNCSMTGILRNWGNSYAVFNETSADFDSAISAESFPDGQQKDLSSMHASYGFDTSVPVSALSASQSYFLQSRPGENEPEPQMSWEEEFIKVGRKERKHLKVYVAASRSQDDELARAIAGDMMPFMAAIAIMTTFTAFFLGPFDLLEGRYVLGACGVYMVLLATYAGFGIAGFCGLPVTSITAFLPFIMLGIGVDDMFIITNAYDSTSKSLSPPQRVQLAMARVGMSISFTTITDILVSERLWVKSV